MTSLDIVSAINKRMAEKEVTRSQLAREIGVSRNTIRNWLSYENAMPMDYGLIILHKLGLDVWIVVMEAE